MEKRNKKLWYDSLVEMINSSLLQAKMNPLNNIYIICDHPQYLEEAFLQHTKALFNIEILTYDTLIRHHMELFHINEQVLSSQELSLVIYHILQAHPQNIFSQNIDFSMLKRISDCMFDFENYKVKETDTTSLPSFSQTKLKDLFLIYNELKKQNISLSLETTLINNTLLENNDTYIFLDYPSHLMCLDYMNYLDANHHVIVYKDEDIHDESFYHRYLTTHFHDVKIAPYDKEHPFQLLVESHKQSEVQAVISHLYAHLVDGHHQLSDYAIYYPNDDYRQLIEETLDRLSICHSVNKKYYNKAYLTLIAILKYYHTKNELDLLYALDYQCLNLSFYDIKKKRYQEEAVLDLDNTFIQRINTIDFKKPLNELNQDMIEFIKTYFINNEVSIALQEYLKSFALPYTLDSQLYLNYLQTYPLYTSVKEKEKINSLYLFDYHQSYSALFNCKYIYCLGLNQDTVPITFKDTDIIMNYEAKCLQLPTTLVKQKAEECFIDHLLSQPHKSITLSYASSSLDGEQLVVSQIINTLQTMFDIPHIHQRYSILQPHVYLNQGKNDNDHKLNHIIQNYKITNNQIPPLLHIHLDGQMSASKFESYNKCPYLYFMSYSLQLYPFNDSRLQMNEIGSLTHYIMEKMVASFDQFHQDTLQDNINTLIEQYVNEHFLVKMSLPINHYFIEQLKKDLYNTIIVLYQQYLQGAFTNKGRETRIISDFNQFQMKGFIDRDDLCQNYVKVIDYKSSDRDIDIDLAKQGFNIQMLLYLDMLSKENHYDPGAVLYFTTKKRKIEADMNDDDLTLANQYYQEFKMNGYTLSDVVFLIDQDIEETRKSNIINVALNKDDTFKSGSRVLDRDEFKNLLDEIIKHLYSLYTSLSSGDISILPAASDNTSINSKINPCKYCQYKSLCHFDIFYNQTKTITKGDQ